MTSLFDEPAPEVSGVDPGAPLAVRMRPRSLDEVVGQDHLLAPGAPLRRLVEAGDGRVGPASVVLWGPPGSGKTTLAHVLSGATGRRFVELSAVTAGVRDVRRVYPRALFGSLLAAGVVYVLVGLAAAGLSAVYAGRVLTVVLARPAGEEHFDEEEDGIRRIGPASAGVAAVLAVFAAGLGVLAVPAVAEPLKALLGVEGEPSPAVEELVLSGALAAVALIGTVVLLHRRPGVAGALEHSPLAAWAGLGKLLSRRPAMAVARVLATLDDRVVDRVVEGAASATRRTATGAARLDGGVVDGAVRATAEALRRAGAAARRPQTGLLHQYYAQAAAGLGVLLVLLLVVR